MLYFIDIRICSIVLENSTNDLHYTSTQQADCLHLLKSNFPFLPKALRILNGFTHRKGNMITANMFANSGKHVKLTWRLVSGL